MILFLVVKWINSKLWNYRIIDKKNYHAEKATGSLALSPLEGVQQRSSG